jgi:regulator of sigma D
VTDGAGSDNRGSARLVDEWLQVRHALSIENFLQDIHSWSSLVFYA